jgi:hypothetical protein
MREAIEEILKRQRRTTLASTGPGGETSWPTAASGQDDDF